MKICLNEYLKIDIKSIDLELIEHEIKYNINIKISKGKIYINSKASHSHEIFIQVRANEYSITKSKNKLNNTYYNKKYLFENIITDHQLQYINDQYQIIFYSNSEKKTM